MTINTSSMTIAEYLEAFAGSSPVPGGGGAAGVAGALAASAAQMVCSLTMGKKRYASIEEEVARTAAHLEACRQEFLRLSDADAEAFEPLSAAYSRKDISPEEMDALLETAAGVPLAIMQNAAAILPDIRYMYENGSKLARSDAACAFSLARACMECASYNVQINTKAMKNREKAEEIDGTAARLLAEIEGNLLK